MFSETEWSASTFLLAAHYGSDLRYDPIKGILTSLSIRTVLRESLTLSILLTSFNSTAVSHNPIISCFDFKDCRLYQPPLKPALFAQTHTGRYRQASYNSAMSTGSLTLTPLPYLRARESLLKFRDKAPFYEYCPAAASQASCPGSGTFEDGPRKGQWSKTVQGLKVDWTATGLKIRDDPEGRNTYCGGFEYETKADGTKIRTYYGGGDAGAQWTKVINEKEPQLPSGPPTRNRLLASAAKFDPASAAHATGIPRIQAIGRSYIPVPVKVVLDDDEPDDDEPGFYEFPVGSGMTYDGGFPFVLKEKGISGTCWTKGNSTSGEWQRVGEIVVKDGGWRDYMMPAGPGHSVKCTEHRSRDGNRTSRAYTQRVGGKDVSNGWISVEYHSGPAVCN